MAGSASCCFQRHWRSSRSRLLLGERPLLHHQQDGREATAERLVDAFATTIELDGGTLERWNQVGVGTGLGTAMIFDGIVVPLELAHLPYRNGFSYEDYAGAAGLERRGKKRWRKSVLDIVARLKDAMVCDYVLLGGGNSKLMQELPKDVILGANSNAIEGGLKLWDTPSAGPRPALITTTSSNSVPPSKSVQ